MRQENAEQRKKRKQKRKAILMGNCFLTVLIVGFAANLIVKEKEMSEKENRVLSQRPALNAADVLSGKWQEDYEEYYNDQFPLRDSLIPVKTTLDRLSGRTDENGVYLGSDGYLMEAFDPQAVNETEETLAAISGFTARHSEIKQYFLLAPTAVNILSDKLPVFTPDSGQNAYMDNAFRAVEKSGVVPVDVREAFEAKKEKKQLYYKTDHHWTTAGAYEASLVAGKLMGLATTAPIFKAVPVTGEFQGTLSARSGFRTGAKEEIEIYQQDIISSVADVPSIIEYPETQKKTGSFYQTEYLDTRDGYAMFLGGNYGEVKIMTPVQENKRLLVLKDSYANCFLPFLTRYYREIVVIDPRYYYGDLEELMEVEEINEVLYLYNANTFFQDTSLKTVLAAEDESQNF